MRLYTGITIITGVHISGQNCGPFPWKLYSSAALVGSDGATTPVVMDLHHLQDAAVYYDDTRYTYTNDPIQTSHENVLIPTQSSYGLHRQSLSKQNDLNDKLRFKIRNSLPRNDKSKFKMNAVITVTDASYQYSVDQDDYTDTLEPLAMPSKHNEGSRHLNKKHRKHHKDLLRGSHKQMSSHHTFDRPTSDAVEIIQDSPNSSVVKQEEYIEGIVVLYTCLPGFKAEFESDTHNSNVMQLECKSGTWQGPLSKCGE